MSLIADGGRGAFGLPAPADQTRIAPASAAAPLARPPVHLLALVGALACALIALPKLGAVWATGQFFDTDDAMRMAQLRDLLAGQAWSDVTQTRMNAPDGLAMHWSRVIDAPLAALLSLFEALTSAQTGERLTRIVWPFALHVGFFAALIHMARLANGGRGAVAALLFGVGMLATNGQYEPGRIDHHNAQILLLLCCMGSTLAAFEEERARMAALSGALAALSLSISVENTPFLAAIAFGLVLLLAWEPRRSGAVALWFGLGFAASAFGLFAAAVPPSRWLEPAPDAFSIFHLTAALSGGAMIAGLHLILPRIAAPVWRLACTALAGGGLLVLLRHVFPACLGDPLASVDPLLRSLWLENVLEARPLTVLLQKQPDLGLSLGMPILLGLAAALIAARATEGAARRRWLLVALALAAGFAAALWQVRAVSSAMPLAAIPAVWLVLTAFDRVAGQRPLVQILPAVAILPFSSMFWLYFTPEPASRLAASGPQAASCTSPAAFEALASLPRTTVLASIDAGAWIVAHTAHSVLAGPYHRNNQGNLLAAHALLAGPERARALVLSSGARIIAICPEMADLALYQDRAPDGLAAVLRRGETPDWLSPVVAGESPWKLYRVR